MTSGPDEAREIADNASRKSGGASGPLSVWGIPTLWGFPTAFFGLAFALRALPWPGVFTSEGLRLTGPDAHYHLRRIEWIVENFPAVLERDPYLSFPDGGQPIWTPVFDWVLALLTRMALGTGDPEGMERMLVWIPPLLGAATVVLLYRLALRTWGTRVAVFAAGVLCVLPPHIWYSQIGFVDHHAAIAFAGAAILAMTLALLTRTSGVASGAATVGLGVAVGGALILWPGCLIHVAIAELALALHVISADSTSEAAARSGRAAIAHAIAWMIVAPLSIGQQWDAWGDVSPVVLSGFQPLWLGIVAIGFGACALATRRGLGESKGRRLALLGTAFAVPGLLCLTLPEFRAGIADATLWLSRGEDFQARVGESLPLLRNAEGFTLRRAHSSLSLLVYALPLMLWLLVRSTRRRPADWLLAAWSAVLFAATLSQYRFANSFSVVWALLIARSGTLAWDWASAWLAERSSEATRRAALCTGAFAAGLLLFAPIAQSHAWALGGLSRALAGEPVRSTAAFVQHEALTGVGEWLKRNSPPTDGWLSPDAAPEYGVLSAWGDGHVLRYIAQRPLVQDNFGNDIGRGSFMRAAEYFAAESEAEALALLEALQVRYVLVRRAGSGHSRSGYSSQSMLARLHQLRGSAGRFGAKTESTNPYARALSRHRLVYESNRPSPDGAGSLYKLFEIVPGARVSGRATPGEVVEARLHLETPDGRTFEYVAHDRADPRGRYQLVLPYPSSRDGSGASQLEATAPYRIQSDGRAATLHIDEADVREGRRLAGPDLVG